MQRYVNEVQSESTNLEVTTKNRQILDKSILQIIVFFFINSLIKLFKYYLIVLKKIND